MNNLSINSGFTQLFEKRLTEHLHSLVPLKEENGKYIFKNPENLHTDEETCKLLFLLLQDQHVAQWIIHKSMSQFQIEKEMDGVTKIKHKMYKHYYVIFGYNGHVLCYKDENDKHSSHSHFLTAAQVQLLKERHYLAPFEWFGINKPYSNQYVIGTATASGIEQAVPKIKMEPRI